MRLQKKDWSVMGKHLTDRQQVKKLMENHKMNTNEENVSLMFGRVVEAMNQNVNITLEQAFSYSYILMAQNGELFKNN